MTHSQTKELCGAALVDRLGKSHDQLPEPQSLFIFVALYMKNSGSLMIFWMVGLWTRLPMN